MTCFHNARLTDRDYDTLREGKPVFCPGCRALLWIKDGHLEIREAHQVSAPAPGEQREPAP